MMGVNNLTFRKNCSDIQKCTWKRKVLKSADGLAQNSVHSPAATSDRGSVVHCGKQQGMVGDTLPSGKQ
jgi:hypothetical protein